MYIRLPGKGNANSHGARPVHLIITMIKWIRTSRVSIKVPLDRDRSSTAIAFTCLRFGGQFKNNYFAEM